ADQSDDDDDEIIVGPTIFAVQPKTFEEVWIPDAKEGKAPVHSNVSVISLSDVSRLSSARTGQAVLSFGSLLHACGFGTLCRPCMFERIPGRCRKVWLCDFCHMHAGRKRRVTDHPTLASTAKS
ncbi:unnamed protein product, partial [Polarella glacialis]